VHAMTVVDDAERYRRELQAHCYRMLGSTHEAEDAVQEALVRAWRGADRFEGRTSLRTWLYRIATNVSLTMLARRASAARVLPQLVAPPSTGLPGPPALDVPWLEPYPDAALEQVADERPGPQARYEMREATQLAFVAAIQYLPPRQRAVLLLREVLGWSAAETASALDVTLASVTSALQRARETLRKNLPDDAPPHALQPHGERERRLLERYVAAWENIDLDGFVALLKEDAIFAMPPRTEWYRGPAAIRGLLAWAWQQEGFTAIRLVPISANGQPAFALYDRDADDAPWRAHAIHVLTLDGERIAAVMNFMNTALFPAFGLPLEA